MKVLLQELPIEKGNFLKMKRSRSQYKKSEVSVIGQNPIQNRLRNLDQRACQNQGANQDPHQG